MSKVKQVRKLVQSLLRDIQKAKQQREELNDLLETYINLKRRLND